MPNLSPTKEPMPTQDPKARTQNFGEVALGYTPAQARQEAQRCLQCKNRPCMAGCPVRVDIPGFVARIAAGEDSRAFEVLYASNTLPAVCGRVCPQEIQCERRCVRGIQGEPVAIGRLERYAADALRAAPSPAPEEPAGGHAAARAKIAVVGAGPAGLTCAGDLARLGYAVTVFEAFHRPGGVLTYGIPAFRLPKDVVAYEIDKLRGLGVEIRTNVIVGKTLTAEELLADHAAVFLGTGAGLPNFMGIPGESLSGVFSANEYLTRVNLMRAYDEAYDTPVIRSRRVAVVGGGNVAMDAARCALRLGAENVSVVYRRSEAEMPARQEEIRHAREEGVSFVMLAAPVRVLGDERQWVRGLECVRMALGEPGQDGRRSVGEVPASNFVLEADTVIVAIGNRPNTLVEEGTAGLERDRRNCLIVDEQTLRASRDGVYAGGDIVTGAATVIQAMGAGKRAAASIDAYIRGK
ncbi:MAG: NADPH-dependent glutamate synthase [Oscillospiraceae bacterium]|nr:NADPH-dependent glutamate synthase [Oscillospiraceae bacterium]